MILTLHAERIENEKKFDVEEEKTQEKNNTNRSEYIHGKKLTGVIRKDKHKTMEKVPSAFAKHKKLKTKPKTFL